MKKMNKFMPDKIEPPGLKSGVPQGEILERPLPILTLKGKNFGRESMKSFILVTSALLFSFMARVPFLNVPLDRDSAGYAVCGRLMSKGFILYKDVFEHKPPGLHFIFAWVYKFFDLDVFGVNLFASLWSLFNVLAIYLFTREAFKDRRISFLAALLFGLFSSSPLVNGIGALTENFMITFIILGNLFVLKALRQKGNSVLSRPETAPFRAQMSCGRSSIQLLGPWGTSGFSRRGSIFFAGILFGSGLIFKQVAMFEFAAACIFFCAVSFGTYRQIRLVIKGLVLCLAGFLIPVIFCVLYFWLKGALKDFVLCTFNFNLVYVGLGNKSVGTSQFVNSNVQMFQANSLLYLGGIAFIVYAAMRLAGKPLLEAASEKTAQPFLLLPLWSIFTFAGICLGKRFFSHYYINLLPSLSIMAAFIMVSFFNLESKLYRLKRFAIAVMLFSLAYSFWLNYKYYIVYTPDEISMRTYEGQAFVSARQLGAYLKENTDADDRIFNWSDEAEVLFYAQRIPVTRYMWLLPYTFLADGIPGAMDEVQKSLFKHPPKYIVIDTRFLDWFAFAKYQNKGMGDFFKKHNYVLEKDFPVIYGKTKLYDLLTYRLEAK